MNCDAVRQSVDEALDERGDPLVRERVLRHVESCPECAVVLERARALRALLDSESRHETAAPANLLPDVRQRLLRERVAPARLSGAAAWLRGPGLRLACCAGAVALGLVALSSRVPRSDPQPSAPAPPRAAAREERVSRDSLEAVRLAAVSNSNDEPFADARVLDLAQEQAGDLATACLDL